MAKRKIPTVKTIGDLMDALKGGKTKTVNIPITGSSDSLAKRIDGNVHQKGGRGGGVARVKKGATAIVSYLFVLERLFRNEEGGPGVCMRWNITN